MANFSWNEEFRVGDEKIDSQHQYLFALANDLLESESKEALTGNAMLLFRYVREHFSHEEALMRKIDYPAYKEHAAQHEQLIDRLSAISADIGKDRWCEADLQSFMSDWVLTHILKVDTQLGAYISKG